LLYRTVRAIHEKMKYVKAHNVAFLNNLLLYLLRKI
jgi:hypothetical protein